MTPQPSLKKVFEQPKQTGQYISPLIAEYRSVLCNQKRQESRVVLRKLLSDLCFFERNIRTPDQLILQKQAMCLLYDVGILDGTPERELQVVEALCKLPLPKPVGE